MTNRHHITFSATHHVPKWRPRKKRKYENRLDWIYTCSLFFFKSLRNTLFNIIKVLVKVRNKVMVRARDKVRFRAGIQGWNVYYRGSVIALDSSHNPPRTIRTPKVSFRVPQERRGTWQNVDMLRLGSENALVYLSRKFSPKILIFELETSKKSKRFLHIHFSFWRRRYIKWLKKKE